MNESKEISSAAGKAVLVDEKSKCQFCGCRNNDVLKFGPKYQLGNVKIHYYCALLSNNLKQNGKDDEGVLGFLLKDINKELKRCSKIKCVYCSKNTANISCQMKNCKNSFHLPCGLKMGTLHQFKGAYDSYCHIHRKLQSIPKHILKEAENNKVVCSICYDKVPIWDKIKYIWAPCCQKTWYHKKCLQRLALSAGYFFKCAICSNNTKFISCVLNLGVFIPQQDASWELVPDAYSDLLFKYEQCDAEICNCPNGRKVNSEDSIWKVILCKSCGSQGIHVGCINSEFRCFDWECSDCQKVTMNLKPKEAQKENADASGLKSEIKTTTSKEFFTKKRSRLTEDLENFVLDKRKKCKNDIEEDDVEIDVVTVENLSGDHETEDSIMQSSEVTKVRKTSTKDDLEEVLASVKPGPLSYKLRVIENFTQHLETSKNQREEVKDFPLETIDLATSSRQNDGIKFFAPADFNIVMWNEDLDVVIVDPDQSECLNNEEKEIIILEHSISIP